MNGPLLGAAFGPLFDAGSADTVSALATFGRDFLATFITGVEAFLLSLPLGLVSGLAAFHSGRLRPATELGLDFLRSVPMTAFMPFFLILFGVGGTALAAGVFASSLLIALGTLQGLKARNATRMGVLRLLDVSGLRRFVLLELPESASQVFVGLRAGVSLSLVLVIVTEMTMGVDRGLGKVIAQAGPGAISAESVCAFLAAGLMGYSFNGSLALLERRIVHWKGR